MSSIVRLAGAVGLLVAGAAGLGACGGDAVEEADELRGWHRTEVIGHADVARYDRVAAAGDGRSLAWLSRAPGDTLALAVYGRPGSGDGVTDELAMPAGVDGGLVVPAALAVDGRGWTAVAELKDEPGGRAAALAVWSGAPGAPGPPATLALPDGHVLSRTVSAARSGDVAIVVALVGEAPAGRGLPEPSAVVTWTSPIPTDGSAPAREWRPSRPDLGTDGPLTTVEVAGAGPGLLLAGTAAHGPAGLWSSADGSSWEAVGGAGVPTDASRLDLLAPLGDGEAVVAWRTGEAGRTVDLARYDGSSLEAAGTVAAPDGGGTIDVTSAALAGDRLVVGGSVMRASTWAPRLWAPAGEDGWAATDQPELVGHLDWSVQALAADGEDRMAAVMVSTPSHIDVATWAWERPE